MEHIMKLYEHGSIRGFLPTHDYIR